MAATSQPFCCGVIVILLVMCYLVCDVLQYLYVTHTKDGAYSLNRLMPSIRAHPIIQRNSYEIVVPFFATSPPYLQYPSVYRWFPYILCCISEKKK